MDGYNVPKSADTLPQFRRSLTGSTSGMTEPRKMPSQSALPMPGTSGYPHGVDLVALQSYTEQNRLKLAQVEKAVTEVSRKLEDWSDVTKSGMENLRSEIGAMKLEHRFSQTLRSTNSRDEGASRVSVRQPGSPSLGQGRGGSPDSSQVGDSVHSTDVVLSSKRLEAVEAACQDLRLNMQEVTSVPEATERLLKAEIHAVMRQLRDELQLERTKAEQNAVDLIRVEASGAECLRRVTDAERRLRGVQQDYLSETVAVKGRLEVAVRECDQQLSRADELHANFKAELLQATSELQERLQVECNKVEQNTLGISHIEALSAEMSRRLEETDRKLWQLQQAQAGQSAESTAVRSRLEVAVRECQEQFSQADALRALLHEEKDRRMSESSALLTRVEAVEQAMSDAHGQQATTLITRLQRLEDSCQEVPRAEEAPIGLEDTAKTLRLELRQEVEQLRVKVEQAKVDCFNQVEARSAELRSRMQDIPGQERPQVHMTDNFQKLLQEAYAKFLEGCRQETAVLTTRLDGVEHQLATMPGPAALQASPPSTVPDAEIASVCARVENLEAAQAAMRDVARRDDPGMAAVLARVNEIEVSQIMGLRERLQALENSQRYAGEASKDVPETTSPVPAAVPPDGIDDLRRALAATSGDVACLARDLAAVREEHDAAITGIGGLTEFVARAAATSIQRTEERLAEELASKREEFEKEAYAQREALSLKAQAMLAEALRGQQVNRRRGLESLSPSNISAQGGEQQAMSAVDILAVQLRAEAAAQAASSEARIAAAEAVFTADLKRFRGMLSACVGQLEAAQVESHDLRPRVAALEAAVAARDRKLVGAQASAASATTSATPTSQSAARWALDASRQLSVTSSEVPSEQRQHSPTRVKAPVDPLRGSLGPGDREAAPPGSAWHSAFQKVMHTPTPSVISVSESQHPGQRVEEGLKEKLEGIVSSVHQVLGALNLQQKQPSESVALAMLSQSAASVTSVAPTPIAPLASPGIMQLDQSFKTAGMRGMGPLAAGGAGGGGSPVREHSPYRRLVAQDHVMPQPQAQLPSPSGSSLMSRPAIDEATSLPSRMPLQAPEHRRSPDGSPSPTPATGSSRMSMMPGSRGRSHDQLCNSRSGHQPRVAQPGHLGASVHRSPGPPVPGGIATGPVTGMANAAASALAGAHSGLRDPSLRTPSHLGVQAMGSSASNAGSTTSAKPSTKSLMSRSAVRARA